MAKAPIHEEITAKGALVPLPSRQRWVRLTRRDKLFILWCKSQGVSMLTAAKRLPTSPDTVLAYIERVRLDPRIALNLGLW